ncbi:MAG: Gfo/Idh/MocA family oxidoreductase [Oscillospiraceae bacterium]|nr:Gfo/Idh/MocA family oxidoreductase [Oscillospiraceae bacterium]
MENPSKIKTAIIGTGCISNEHINGYINNPNTELYALCDINPERVSAMAEKYGIPSGRTFTDKNEMLKALPEIDAVSVCTWNSAHAECSIAALEAGKHVLCEKPMAMNAREAEAMKAAADKAGKLLMIGFVRRHGNDAKLILDYAKTGFFGDIYYAKAAYLRRHGCPGGWFGDKSRSGGGPLIDLGVHVIDLVRYLLGNPKPVSIYGATFQKLLNRPNVKTSVGYTSAEAGNNDIFDVEDLASALIRFAGGAVLSVEASFSLNIKSGRGDIELFGTKAGATLDPIEFFTEMNGYMVDVNFPMKTSLSFDGLFKNEINHYVDCIVNGTECIAPAEDGVQMMRILDGVYESARTGHEIVLSN